MFSPSNACFLSPIFSPLISSGSKFERYSLDVIEKPNKKGAQWVNLGSGRWMLNGDGNYNNIMFLQPESMPMVGVLNFEIESISGGSIRFADPSTVDTGIASHFLSEAGTYSFEIKSKTMLGLNQQFVRHFFGERVNCVIKNISFVG